MAIKKKKPLTGAQRTKASNNRKIAAGLVSARVWMHPDETESVRAYAAKKPLTKAILKSLKEEK